MKTNNIFEGKSSCAEYARVVYRLLCKHDWFTYMDVWKESKYFNEEKPIKANKQIFAYDQLKKAFSYVRDEFEKRDIADLIEERGNNRQKSFRYVGEKEDPLADLINAKVINDLKVYWQFCQDSEGFFPTSWLDYFFQDTRDLLNIKDKRRNGEQVLSASIDRNLKNIDLLPQLYDYIKQQQVLEIHYVPFKELPRKLIFHPQYLKEFNGRWWVLGVAENPQTDHDYIFALDRIADSPKPVQGYTYKVAQKGFFRNHFKDLVGVTLRKGTETVEVRVRAHDNYIFKLTETKKIHPSQQTIVPFANHDGVEYGEFLLCVKPNNELFGQILMMGADLEIMSPASVRQEMAEKGAKMQRLYE